jgi:hypothetical protein
MLNPLRCITYTCTYFYSSGWNSVCWVQRSRCWDYWYDIHDIVVISKLATF